MQLGACRQNVDFEGERNILADLELNRSRVNLADVSGHVVLLFSNFAELLSFLRAVQFELARFGKPLELLVQNEVRHSLDGFFRECSRQSPGLILLENNWTRAPGLWSSYKIDSILVVVEDIGILSLQRINVAVDHQVAVPEF